MPTDRGMKKREADKSGTGWLCRGLKIPKDGDVYKATEAIRDLMATESRVGNEMEEVSTMLHMARWALKEACWVMPMLLSCQNIDEEKAKSLAKNMTLVSKHIALSKRFTTKTLKILGM